MNNKEAIKQIEWVKKRISDITYSPESFEALNLAIKALEERPTGEWNRDINGWHVCSNCHMIYKGMPTIDRKPRWQYCPTCGAKMKEAENETN